MFNQFANKIAQLRAPFLSNNTVITPSIDMNLFPNAGSATFYFCVGNVDTTITTIRLRQSTDNSTWSDIPGATFGNAAYTATDDDRIVIQPISLAGKQRYIQCSALIGNGATGANVAVFAVIGDNMTAPVRGDISSYSANSAVLFVGNIV